MACLVAGKAGRGMSTFNFVNKSNLKFTDLSELALESARDMAKEIVKTDPLFRLSEYAEKLPYRSAHMRDKVIGALRGAGLPA